MTNERCNFESGSTDLKSRFRQQLAEAQIELQEAITQKHHYKFMLDSENNLLGEVDWIADAYYDDYDPQAATQNLAEYKRQYDEACQKTEAAYQKVAFYTTALAGYDYPGLD